MTRMPTLSNDTRARVKRLGEPLALALGQLGLTPNGLTLIGFAITAVGGILAGAELWLLAGVVVFVGGAFDMFDGTLARATGRVSKAGAFMDSVFDRGGEAVTYAGIVVGCTRADFDLGVGLATIAMAAAFLVSYTRAKSESLGFAQGTGMAEVGLAPREVRLVILVVGLVWVGLSGGLGTLQFVNGSGRTVLASALGLIGVLATITVIQRILHVRQQAVASGGK